MSSKDRIEARVRSITEELRSRGSTSARQAEFARASDNREAEEEAPDDELSTSEAQARRSAKQSPRGWRAVGESSDA